MDTLHRAALAFHLDSAAAPTPMSPVDEAWLLGHSLGQHSEISEPPAGYSQEESAAFRAGWAIGKAHPADFSDVPNDPHWYASADGWDSWTDELRIGIPSEADARLMAEENGANHDAQGDPNAIELWSQTSADFYDAEREAQEASEPADWSERAQVLGHRVLTVIER